MELLSVDKPKVTIYSSDTLTVNLFSMKPGKTTEEMATLKITAEDQPPPCKKESPSTSRPLIIRSERNKYHNQSTANIYRQLSKDSMDWLLSTSPPKTLPVIQIPVSNHQKPLPQDQDNPSQTPPALDVLIGFEFLSSLIRTRIHNPQLKNQLLDDVNQAKSHLHAKRIEKIIIILTIIIHKIQLAFSFFPARKNPIDFELLRVIAAIEKRLMEFL